MDFNVNEFDSIMQLIYGLLGVFSKIGYFLSFSARDFLSYVGLNIPLPSFFDNLTPLALMVGGLGIYLAYQFLTWLLNVVT